jgi:hypothetical protein
MTANSDIVARVTVGRKRKLDHLSVEEKVERKKLKNRVAAQTSRDRKKRQVEDMVETIEQQARKITSLEKENKQLHAKYDKLEREFQRFKALSSSNKKQQQQQHSIPEEHKYNRTLDEEMTDRDISADFNRIKSDGSAVSNFKPLPKVSQMRLKSTVKSARKFPQQDKTKALVQLLILCLFYKKSMTSLSASSLKKLMTYSKISTQSLKEALMEMPRYKAINAHCLDNWWGSHNHQWNPMKIEVAQ